MVKCVIPAFLPVSINYLILSMERNSLPTAILSEKRTATVLNILTCLSETTDTSRKKNLQCHT